MSEGHALFAPSGAKKWMVCAASLLAEKGLPDTSSKYADEGTAAHTLAAHCLQTGADASSWLGKVIPAGERNFEVDDEMAESVQTYINEVRAVAFESAGATMFVEQRVSFGEFIGVPDQEGTSDAVVFGQRGELGGVLSVHDLKYGRGVREHAATEIAPGVFRPNKQLACYALGALALVELLGDVDYVELHIHQPRLDHHSQYLLPIEELMAFVAEAKHAAEKALDIYTTGIVGIEDYTPGDDQCRFCKARSMCPAVRAQVEASLGADFEDISKGGVDGAVAAAITIDRKPHTLGMLMGLTDQIEGFCKAVRAEVEARLLRGEEVPGWKIVGGRKGHRAWASKEDAEKTLKRMRLKIEDMYDFKVISPTSAEKLAKKGVIGKRQWPELQGMIVQPDGAPSVAPESDPRPALVLRSANDFEALPPGAEDLV